MSKKITTDQKKRKNEENFDGSYRPRGSQRQPKKSPPKPPPKQQRRGGEKGKRK